MDWNSKVANFSAKFSITEQANHVVLNTCVCDSFPQHGDQVSLRTTSTKLVDDVNVNHRDM
jgi:hypothetical protein